MKKILFSGASVAILLFVGMHRCTAQQPSTDILKQNSAELLKQGERYTMSIALKFSKKNQNGVQKALSLLFDSTANAHATGFLIGDGLVMTAYHVVSGELSPSKRKLLGFNLADELEITASINNCHARVVKVDKLADLALLKMCEKPRRKRDLTFQTAPEIDEKLVLVARPNDNRVIRKGSFHGLYTFRGQEYLSAKIEGRDGFSGSPVYNTKGEVIGVFCLYDWARGLALVSPGVKVKKLIEDYYAETSAQP